ncbi:MAG TPA: hypothetical protein VNE63_19715 [Candidatus Acidoferrales bacterium]|nr:hypothetical protein [Candidatus Acidoferrales bacterium]
MEGMIARVQLRCGDTVTENCIGERRLWTAVIITAVEDWRRGSLRAHRIAQQFLFENERDFNRVCADAGLDPGSLRGKLLKIGHRVEMQRPWTRPVAA